MMPKKKEGEAPGPGKMLLSQLIFISFYSQKMGPCESCDLMSVLDLTGFIRFLLSMTSFQGGIFLFRGKS